MDAWWTHLKEKEYNKWRADEFRTEATRRLREQERESMRDYVPKPAPPAPALTLPMRSSLERFREVERGVEPPLPTTPQMEEHQYVNEQIQKYQRGEINYETLVDLVQGTASRPGGIHGVLGKYGPDVGPYRGEGGLKERALHVATPFITPGTAYLPPEARAPFEAIKKMPGGEIVAPRLENLLSPVGLGFLATMPALTARMETYGAGLGVAGKGVEKTGFPIAETPIGRWGPSGIGELAGTFAGPVVGPTLERAALSGAKAAPAAGRAALAETERLMPRVGQVVMEEAGGLKPRPQTFQEALEALRRARGRTGPEAAARFSIRAQSGIIEDKPITVGVWRDVEQAHFLGPQADDLLRATAERLNKAGKYIPGLDRALRTTAGPAAVARQEPAFRLATTYRLVEEIQDSTLRQSLARLEAALPFQAGGKPGQVKLGGKWVAFADIAENPRVYSLTDPQRKWIEDAWRVVDRYAVEYESATGRVIRTQKAGREHYWPRFALDEKGRAWVKSPIGAKQSPAQERLFLTMEEGIAEGVPYASPVDSLNLYARSVSKMTRDNLLMKVAREEGILRYAVRPTRGEVSGATLGPAFRNTALDPETLVALKGPLGKGQGWLRPAEKLSSIPRMLVTGAADVGHFMIQGLTLLASSPRRWSMAVFRGFQNMATPRQYARWIGNNPAAKRAAQHGVDLAGSEFTEAGRAGGALGGVPLLGTLTKTVARNFDGYLAAGRVYKFDAMADIVLREEGPKSLYRLGRYVNTMLGTPSLKGLGLSATQRQIEGAFVFFSPRYTRSILGMAGYLFGKGVLARDARLTLGKMAFGGMATFYALARGVGLNHEETLERMNPQSGSRFMSMPIGGVEVGFGSAYRSLLAFLGNLTVEDNWKFDSWNDAALSNPIVRYLRSRTAPVTGTLVDFIQGEDFLGYEVNLDEFVTNPGRTLEYAYDKFLPLNIQAIIEAEGVPTHERVLAGVVETFGGRTYPRSASVLLEELAQETEGKSFWELDFEERKRFLDGPEARRLYDEMLAQGVRRDREWAVSATEREQEDRQFETQLEGALQNPENSLAAITEMYQDYKIETAPTEIEEREARSEGERLAHEYWAIKPEEFVVNGVIDWNAFYEERDRFLKLHPGLKEKLDRNEVLRWESRTVRDFVVRLQGAEELLSQYYDIPTKLGMTPEEQEEVQPILARARTLQAMNPGLQLAQVLMTVADVPDHLKMRALLYNRLPDNPERQQFRAAHPEIREFFPPIGGAGVPMGVTADW